MFLVPCSSFPQSLHRWMEYGVHEEGPLQTAASQSQGPSPCCCCCCAPPLPPSPVDVFQVASAARDVAFAPGSRSLAESCLISLSHLSGQRSARTPPKAKHRPPEAAALRPPRPSHYLRPWDAPTHPLPLPSFPRHPRTVVPFFVSSCLAARDKVVNGEEYRVFGTALLFLRSLPLGLGRVVPGGIGRRYEHNPISARFFPPPPDPEICDTSGFRSQTAHHPSRHTTHERDKQMLGKHCSADHLTRAWLQKSPIVSVVSILKQTQPGLSTFIFHPIIDSRFEGQHFWTRPGATSKDPDLTVEFT